MRAIFLLPFVSMAFLGGCANHSRPAETPETLAATVPGPIRSIAGSRSAGLDRSPAPIAALAELRQTGDFVVHRFTGSFRKAPLRLTQKVVAIEGALVTVDVSLTKDIGARTQPEGGARLRIVFDKTPGATREVAKVTRLVGEREEAGTLEDYEMLMAETVVVPDRNEDLLGTEVVSAKVGDRATDCKKTSYRVALGKTSAVLSTLTSDGFAWGDVGGEIRSDDGKIIYRAEVIESGRAGTASASARASASPKR